MRLCWFAFASGCLLTFQTGLRADFPPAVHLSESLPPSDADWFRLALKRQLSFGAADCFVKPVVVWKDVYYFPCLEESICGTPTHMSYRGVYGTRHPMPYYIAEPKIDPEELGVPCLTGSFSRRHSRYLPLQPQPVDAVASPFRRK